MLNPKPQIPNPKPQTPNPKVQTLGSVGEDGLEESFGLLGMDDVVSETETPRRPCTGGIPCLPPEP